MKREKDRLNNQELHLSRAGHEDRTQRGDKEDHEDHASREDDNIEHEIDDKDDDDFDSSTKIHHKKCHIDHLSGKEHCSHKDEVCKNLNCKWKKDHIMKNCPTKEEGRYRNKGNNNIDDASTSSSTTSKEHLEMIQINISTTSSTLNLVKLEWITLNKVDSLSST